MIRNAQIPSRIWKVLQIALEIQDHRRKDEDQSKEHKVTLFYVIKSIHILIALHGRISIWMYRGQKPTRLSMWGSSSRSTTCPPARRPHGLRARGRALLRGIPRDLWSPSKGIIGVDHKCQFNKLQYTIVMHNDRIHVLCPRYRPTNISKCTSE